MSRMLAILTAGLISLHALLGCCGLHLCDSNSPETCQVACDHQGCQHEHSEEPGECCLVCRGASNYLLPEKPHFDDSISFVAAVIPTALTGLSDCSSGAGLAKFQGTALGPPLRLHLLHQILLI
jgi:hypothetical protein